MEEPFLSHETPGKDTLIHVSVFAAKGGGETAEAYFDDFSIRVQDDPAVPVKPDEKKQVTQFFFSRKAVR